MNGRVLFFYLSLLILLISPHYGCSPVSFSSSASAALLPGPEKENSTKTGEIEKNIPTAKNSRSIAPVLARLRSQPPSTRPAHVSLVDSFFQWCRQHGKTYFSHEIRRKFQSWINNFLAIKKWLASPHGRRASFSIGLTEDSDLSPEEFRATRLGGGGENAGASEGEKIEEIKNSPVEQENQENLEEIHPKFNKLEEDEFHSLEIPDSSYTTDYELNDSLEDFGPPVDWRGKLPPIQSQKQCASCSVFGALAALEGAYSIKFGSIRKFSEQHILNCITGVRFTMGSSTLLGMGCKGNPAGVPWAFLLGALSRANLISEQVRLGIPIPDFSFEESTKSPAPLPLLRDVSYEAVEQSCSVLQKSRYSDDSPRVPFIPTFLHSVRRVFTSTISSLIEELRRGPLSLTIIGADQPIFRHYRGGLIDSPVVCQPMARSTGASRVHAVHVVALVGFSSENGIFYWILRNSWGMNHGEYGYIRMKIGENICGLEREGAIAYRPILG